MNIEIKTEKKEVLTIQEVRTFTLTLNQDEANLIRSLAGRVIGTGKARNLADAIYSKLCEGTFSLKHKSGYVEFSD